MNINNKPLTSTQMRDYIASQDFSTRAKKRLTKSDSEFVPPSADVGQMCIEAGHPEYFDPLRNRIFRAMDTNMALMNCAMIDLSQPNEIRLPDSGVMAFRDILISYFTETDVDALYEYLQGQTELEKCKYSLQQNIKAASSSTLRNGIVEWEKMVCEKRLDRKAADQLKDMAQRELKTRKKIF